MMRVKTPIWLAWPTSQPISDTRRRKTETIVANLTILDRPQRSMPLVRWTAHNGVLRSRLVD